MAPFRIAAGGSVRGLAMSVGRWGGSFCTLLHRHCTYWRRLADKIWLFVRLIQIITGSPKIQVGRDGAGFCERHPSHLRPQWAEAENCPTI